MRRRLRGPGRALIAAILLAGAALSPAQDARKPVTLDTLTRQPALGAPSLREVRWVAGSNRLSYLKPGRPGQAGPLDLWTEEAGSGKKTMVLSADSVRAPGEKPSDAAPGPLAGYQWSPDGARVLFTLDNNLWIAFAATGKAAALTRGTEGKEFPEFSPDGARVSYVQNHDLYCVEVASGEVRRLTSDGGDHILNGRLDWVYEEELASRNGKSYVWSPDSRSLAYLRLDENRVPAYPLVDYQPARAAVSSQRYPQPGEPSSVPALRIVGLDGRIRARAGFSPADDLYVLPELVWTPDSTAVGYAVLNREQTRLDFRLLDAITGRTRPLFTESDSCWLNVSNFAAGPPLIVLPRFLKDGTHFLWISERSGFAHLYRGEIATGKLESLTSGPWMVDFLCGLDEANRYIYFLSTRDDARRREIDRVHFDGSGFETLSREAGTHRAELSPDGAYFVDTFSTVSDPPGVRLHRADGGLVRVLAEPSRDAEQYALGQAEWVDLPAADGTILHARLVKPPDFDPTRKYPAVVDVYGGPHAQEVRDMWGSVTSFDHLLAGNGYLIWQLDNRGSWGRGHAFETPIFRELGKTELEDQLAGVRYLRSLPYVDPSRLAITGWSYGGYMTLYAVSHAPEVWKCAVAGAPVTDWRLYDSIYTERYMRTPETNPQGYDRSAPANTAARIRARLLLIHGTADDNVHLQNTIKMIDGLTRADVNYELQIQPAQRHGIHGKTAEHYRYRRVLEFFKRNL